ncbi:MAG: hypothetical protein WC969_07150 [Elusimicrobiota bacterium]|jgi:hypothetical protein
MRLYWNDVVVSRHASAEQIEAAIARLRAEREGTLELRRRTTSSIPIVRFAPCWPASDK